MSDPAEAAQRLADLLDAIDEKKGIVSSKPQQAASSSGYTTENRSDAVWQEYYDAATAKSYYHNFELNLTQWDPPSVGFTPMPPLIVPNNNKNFSDSADFDQYQSKASFNMQTGKFAASGSDTYWDKVGREGDKAGRQLSAFFDLKDLDKNREEYSLKRTQNQNQGGATDWKKETKDKKQDKKRKLNSWLYEP